MIVPAWPGDLRIAASADVAAAGRPLKDTRVEKPVDAVLRILVRITSHDRIWALIIAAAFPAAMEIEIIRRRERDVQQAAGAKGADT